MIVLDTTSKAIEVVLAAAKSTNDMAAAADYADTTAINFVPANSGASTNGTSVVTLVAAPSSGTQRIVKVVSIYNGDTSANTVTVRVNDGGVLRNRAVVNVGVGDTLEYSETFGWKVLQSSGYIKNSAGLGSVLGTANQITATTASGVVTLTIPSAFTVPGGLQVTGVSLGGDGTALAPGEGYISEASLGFYRSGASKIAQSYGQFLTPDGSALAPADGFVSESSLGFYRSANSYMALSYGTLKLPSGISVTGNYVSGDGAAGIPAYTFASEQSLGLYRSGNSVLALSYGTLNTSASLKGGLMFNRLAMDATGSSATTNQSGATAKVADGQLYFSVLSLTTNGAEFGFRSGRTVYRFQSTAVG